MKAITMIVLIALITVPSSSFAWSRGRGAVVRSGVANRAVVVRTPFPRKAVVVKPGFRRRVVVVKPGFPGRAVATGFVGGVATRIVVNRTSFPRSYYYPGPYIHYYPPRYVHYPYYYPPAYSSVISPLAPPDPVPTMPTIGAIPKDTPKATRRR